MSTEPERLDLAGGKYTIVNNMGWLSALRYGQPWREQDLLGDNLVGALFMELQQAREALQNVHDYVRGKDSMYANGALNQFCEEGLGIRKPE